MPSLFHYTKLETLVEHILPSQSLKTSHLDLMNDPREFLPWSFGSTGLPLEEIFSDFYNDATHIRCQYKFGSIVKDRFQVICFSGAKHTGWNNEMLWAHYGQHHAGVCLELDEEKLVSSINLEADFRLENIDYQEKERPWIYWGHQPDFESNIKVNIQRIYRDVAYTKSTFWKKEDERRLLFLNIQQPVLVPIYPALKTIYLGLKFKHEYIPSIEAQLKSGDVKLSMLVYQHNKFERWLLKRDELGRLRSSTF